MQPGDQLVFVKWLRNEIIGAGLHGLQITGLAIKRSQQNDVGVASLTHAADHAT